MSNCYRLTQHADMTKWRSILTLISAGADLTDDQARWAMSDIMAGEASPATIGAFLIGLRVKGETAGEVRGMVEAILASAVTVPLTGPAIDVVGTGGDGAHTVNISTMASLVVAGTGVTVLKHGNRAISSQSGTADVLEALGVAVPVPADRVATCAAEAGMAFCFAPAHHPGFAHAGPVRKELGVPTIFNVLGPLCNPGQPPAALIGCADLRLAPVLAQVQQDRGFAAAIVRSDLGLDEISTSGTTQVWDVTTDQVRHEVLDPLVLGISQATLEDMRGGDAMANAQVAREVLAGHRQGTIGLIRDVVALNAAAALVVFDSTRATHQFGSPHTSFTARVHKALEAAYASLDSGAAEKALARLVAVSAALATQ